MSVFSGYRYIGEDYTVLSKKDDQLLAASIYNTVKLTDKTLQMAESYKMMEDHESIEIPHNLKQAYYLSEIPDVNISNEAKISAICSLSVGREQSSKLTVSTPKQLMKSLIMSTLTQSPGFHGKIIKKTYDAINNIDLYHLTLGLDRKDNMNKINYIFEQYDTRN